MIVTSLSSYTDDYERLLPLMMDTDSILRVGYLSMYAEQNRFTFYEYIDDPSGDYQLQTNPSGRMFFQPCLTAPSQYRHYDSELDIHVWTLGPVRTIYSSHFSPHSQRLPTVTRDSQGTYSTSYGVYDGGMFLPLENYDSSHPALHAASFNGTNVVVETLPTGQKSANLESTRWSAMSARYLANAWFLVRLNGGTATFDAKSARYNAKCMLKSSMSLGDNLISQTTTVKTAYTTGSYTYKLIKTTWPWKNFVQDDPFTPTSPEWITNLQYVDQPVLKVSLANGTTMAVTSWGWDLWPFSF